MTGSHFHNDPNENQLQRQIENLEQIADEVLRLKKDSRPKRPFIIEFCGSPKSGKTQAVTSLTIFLKRNGFNVRVLAERASVSPVSDKRSPLFNLWTGCSVLTGLIPYLSEPVADVDIVIADRGIFDTLCWLTWLVEEKALPEDESKDMFGFFASRRFRQATDLVLAFVASSDKSMEREYSHLLTRKYGSIMSPRVLNSYVTSVDHTIGRFGKDFKALRRIDTSDQTQNGVAVEVTSLVLESMREELVEKVGTISRDCLETVAHGHRTFDSTTLVNGDFDLKFRSRQLAEEDNDHVQIVPVAVLTDPRHTRVMVFKKRREALGHDDSPEKNRNLLYVGGHMRAEDAFGLESSDLLGIARATVQREMSEELGATLPVNDQKPFCIWDFEGHDSSQRHLALVHVVEVNFEELKLRLDGYELVQPHNSNVSGKVVTADEAAKWPSKSVEVWSREILERVLAVSQQSLFK